MSTSRSIIGLCIIALGVALFGAQYGWWVVDMGKLWPIFLLIPGLAFLTASSQRRRPAFLIPGVILTVYALTFFLDTWTNFRLTDSLSFIFTFAVALAFFAYAAADEQHRPGLIFTGWVLTAISAVVLLSTTSNGRLWPLLLIVLGLMMIFRPRRIRLPKSETPGSAQAAPTSQFSRATVLNEAIQVSYPLEPDPTLNIEFGAGSLQLKRGDESAIVKGTARYTNVAWKPVIHTDGREVRLRMGDESIWSSLSSWVGRWHNQVNEWVLGLGTKPVHLVLKLGALKGRLDLGGLALHDLKLEHGAADLDVDFSQPNTVPMTMMKLSAGAAKFVVHNLGYAHAAQIEFGGGAGETTLDFHGALASDCVVKIGAGVGKINLIIPAGVPCEITKRGMVAMEIDSHWQQADGKYTQLGFGPKITIVAELGLGALAVRAA